MLEESGKCGSWAGEKWLTKLTRRSLEKTNPAKEDKKPSCGERRHERLVLREASETHRLHVGRDLALRARARTLPTGWGLLPTS